MIPSFFVSTKFKIFLMFFLFLANTLVAETTKSHVSLEELLASYLANHREIQSLMIQLQQQQLSYDSTAISQGLQINLSTGNFSIGSSRIQGEPAISLSMPKLNGTYLEAKVPLQFDLKKDSSSSALQGASITVGTEIIGSSGKSSKLSLLKAERSLQEARRQIQNQALTVEKEFYSKIRELYSSYVNLLSTRNTVYTKKLDLATLQAQGFSASSSRYRTTEMEVLSTQRDADKQQRNLQRELELFSQKCGLELQSLSIEDFAPASGILAKTGILDTLPMGGIEQFTTMESAQWNLFVTQQEIETNTPLSLSAEAGYTHKNQGNGGDNSDTVHGALVLQGFGGKLSGGVTVPITKSQDDNTGITGQVSLSWSPNDMKTQKLQRSQRQLNLQLAQLKIQEAEEKYQETMENSVLTWEDLLWNRQVALEELPLYQQLATDTINLFNRGLTTETEYNQALTNRDRAAIQCEIADLDLIIHHISTRQLFVQEEN